MKEQQMIMEETATATYVGMLKIAIYLSPGAYFLQIFGRALKSVLFEKNYYLHSGILKFSVFSNFRMLLIARY
jgi:hypothetical protein